MSGLRVRHDGRRIDRVAHTGGRPLGLELLPDGRLLVCDAQRGLLRVDPAGGRIELAVRDVAGTPMVFCNNAAVAADGTVFFSDSSTRYGIEDWKKDFVEDTRTGRLLRLDTDGTVTVLLDGLAFANGGGAGPGRVVRRRRRDRCAHRRTPLAEWSPAGTSDLLVGDLPRYPGDRRARARGPGVARQPGRARRRRCRTLTRIT